jgi:putative transposase
VSRLTSAYASKFTAKNKKIPCNHFFKNTKLLTMSHTNFNQLIHVLWSTKNQQQFLAESLKGDMYAYLTALAKSKNCKILLTGGNNDHVHLLLLLHPEISISNLMCHLKSNSSKWVKSNKRDSEFAWHDGYLAVSTQEERMDSVCSYIRLEEKRHVSKSYSEELKEMLHQQDIPFNEYFCRNSYSKIYLHAIWSTNNRIDYLDKTIRPDLFNHLEFIAERNKSKIHAINGIEDHIHVLMEVSKDVASSDLIKDMKTSSTHWLKNTDKIKFKDFGWQIGCGLFTVSKSHFEIVKGYIHKQEEHHRKKNSKEEWEEIMVKKGFKEYVLKTSVIM